MGVVNSICISFLILTTTFLISFDSVSTAPAVIGNRSLDGSSAVQVQPQESPISISIPKKNETQPAPAPASQLPKTESGIDGDGKGAFIKKTDGQESSSVPVVQNNEILISDSFIPEETSPKSQQNTPDDVKSPMEKKNEPAEPPNAAEVKNLVKEMELQEQAGSEKSSYSEKMGAKVSSPTPAPAPPSVKPPVTPIPIPADINQYLNSQANDKSSSSTSTAAAVDKAANVSVEIPPPPLPIAKTEVMSKPDLKTEDKSILPPQTVAKTPKKDLPLPPADNDDGDMYKDEKVDLDALGPPPEDPGIEEDDGNAGAGVEGNLPEPPTRVKNPSTPVDSADGEQKREKVINHYSKIPDHGDPYITELNEESGYFNYFITLLGFFFIGFILFHNKKRVRLIHVLFSDWYKKC